MTPFDFLEMGVSIIPISYRSKIPNPKYLPFIDGQYRWKQYQTNTPCNSDIMKWTNDPYCNLAAVCGMSNLVIVDFDDMPYHTKWLAKNAHKRFMSTYRVSTGKGLHYYYFVEDAPKQTLKIAGKVDIKATGYCLIPPSTHPSGRKYEAINDLPIMTIGSIYDLFDKSQFTHKANKTVYNRKSTKAVAVASNPFNPRLQGSLPSCDELNRTWRILQWFPEADHKSGDWYTVTCPLHDDKTASAWVNTSSNRFGCHACVNGSFSAVDFYMAVNGCENINEAREKMK